MSDPESGSPPPKGPPSPASASPAEYAGLMPYAEIERLAREMADRKPRRLPPLSPPTASPGVAPAAPVMRTPSAPAAPSPTSLRAPISRIDPTIQLPPSVKAALAAAHANKVAAALRPLFTDQHRLTFTPMQSVAATVVVVALAVGAGLMAASSFVAARDWSCRAGLVTRTCPEELLAKPKTLPEIPT